MIRASGGPLVPHQPGDRFGDLLALPGQGTVGQPGEGPWVVLTPGHGVQDRPARHAHDVGNDRAELDVGELQELADPRDFPAPFPDELLARPGQVAQISECV